MRRGPSRTATRRPLGWLAIFGVALLPFALGYGCADRRDLKCATRCQCTDRGLCGQLNGKCVPTEASHCSKAEACRLFGRCTLQENKCVIATDADCHGSEQCSALGKCSARNGSCER